MADLFMIFDDRCPLCLRSVERVKRLDRKRQVQPVPLTRARQQLAHLAVALPSEASLRQQLHLVSSDGRVWAGADAVARLALLSPRVSLLGRLMLLPGVRHAARLVYRLVAQHRHRLH